MAEQQFYTLITNVGQAKLANATALGTKVNFAKLQVGDGKDYNPSEAQENLKHKVWEGNINSITTDSKNKNWIVIQTIIPASVGGFNINEVGIFDNEGNMLIVSKYPSTYKPKLENGSGKDLTIKLVIQVSNTESVTLKIDPSITIATKEDIENINKTIKENQNKANSQYEDFAKQIKDIDLEASKVKVNNSNLESKNVNEALTELFTLADNGKKAWSEVIGEPLKPNDSFSTLKSKTQSIKSELISNLKEKGIEVNNNLSNLIDSIKKISIKPIINEQLKNQYTVFHEITDNQIFISDSTKSLFQIYDFNGNLKKTINLKSDEINFYGQSGIITGKKQYSDHRFKNYGISIYDKNGSLVKTIDKFSYSDSIYMLVYYKNYIYITYCYGGSESNTTTEKYDIDKNLIKRMGTGSFHKGILKNDMMKKIRGSYITEFNFKNDEYKFENIEFYSNWYEQISSILLY